MVNIKPQEKLNELAITTNYI